MIKIDDVKSIKEIMIFKFSGEVLLRTVGSDINKIEIRDETHTVIIQYKNGKEQLFMNVSVMLTDDGSIDEDLSKETPQRINV